VFEKLRALADIGRTHGITTTASVAIVGALTSTAYVEWYNIVYFTIISCFAHMAVTTFIALGDIDLDSQTYVPSRNPISTGDLSKKEAVDFVYIGTIATVILVLLLCLYYEYSYFLMALICFIPSYGWMLWYGWRGKRYLVSYDFSFAVAYSFLVLFGVFAVGGLPTIYTWIFIGVVFFAAGVFSQWENGLKDADADRIDGVKSLAVLTGVKNNMRLHLTHPYFLYGMLLKTLFIFFCFLAFWQYQNIYYLLFILIYGIPSQVFIMYRFLTREKAIDHRKTILLDVTFAGILAYSTIIGKTGIEWVLFLVVYLIVGYLIGSAVQSKSEFKFGRFSQ
jgi:4-hydroxybenzoate polyprenyltransferase